MGQRKRHDGSGEWHHVANRGIARRSVFEGPVDERYFLSRIARAHRRGLLEVYAYCLMITHFHVLVRSPAGQLSEAIRLILSPYVRWFNRSRKRDGPLFRGRFLSRPIKSVTDWWTVFRYIHLNPVKAGVVEDVWEYPHASAIHLVQEGSRPPWLLRRAGSGDRLGVDSGTPEIAEIPGRVRGALAIPLSDAEQEMVERRLIAPRHRDDPLDMLVGGAPSVVRGWLKRKAELADRTVPGLPLATPSVLLEILAELEPNSPGLVIKPGRKAIDGWNVLRVGLLRQACGSTFSEMALRLGASASQAHLWTAEHSRQMLSNEDYSATATRALSMAINRIHGPSAQICRDL